MSKTFRVSARSIRSSPRFIAEDRKADYNNFAPRVGFNYSILNDKLSFHGGYGIYYDRVILELITLERGLDGRALPVEVRAGNATDGRFLTKTDIFRRLRRIFQIRLRVLSCRAQAPRASISSTTICKIRSVQQSNLGLQWEFARNFVFRADLSA